MHVALAGFVACAVLLGFSWPACGAELSRDELTAARKINVTKCAKCHKLYHPSDYSVADWDRWMVKMAKKSKLKPNQTSLLNRYFELERAGAVSEEKRARE